MFRISGINLNASSRSILDGVALLREFGELQAGDDGDGDVDGPAFEGEVLMSANSRKLSHPIPQMRAPDNGLCVHRKRLSRRSRISSRTSEGGLAIISIRVEHVCL